MSPLPVRAPDRLSSRVLLCLLLTASRHFRHPSMKSFRLAFFLAALCISCVTAFANPILRLNSDKMFPIWVQPGTNGPTTSFFEAYNAGDGSLSLQVAGSYPWLSPALGAPAPCTFNPAKTCAPIKVLLNTASLAS